MLEVLTVLCILLVGLAGFCAADARRAATAAHEEVQSIRTSRGRLIANEASIEAMMLRLQKLEGRFYAMARAYEPAAAPAEKQSDAFSGPELTEVCERWRIAQKDGPGSPAASCQCDYCEAMRSQRRLAKAQLVPKTPADIARFAKENHG